MKSFGAELELPAISLELRINRIDVWAIPEGQDSQRHYQIAIPEVIVGPTQQNEHIGLKILAGEVAYLLYARGVPVLKFGDFKKLAIDLVPRRIC